MPKVVVRNFALIESFIKNELDELFRYIIVKIDGDRKMTHCDHKMYTKDEITLDRGDNRNFTHYSLALKHTNIIVIDIDEYNFDYTTLPKLFDTLPYTEGNIKGRHYYLRTNFDKHKWVGTELKVFNDFTGDLIGISLKGNNIWVAKRKAIYNYNNYIPEVDFEKHICPLLIPRIIKILKKAPEQHTNKQIDKNETLGNNTNIKQKDKNKLCENNTIVKQINEDKLCDDTVNNTINDSKNDIMKGYLDCLKNFRFDSRDEWLKISAIIFNENCNFDLFDEYSKKCIVKYDLEENKKVWNSLRENHEHKATIASLRYMAKCDNPENYKKVLHNELKKTKLDIATNESFDFKKFYRLVNEDNENLGNDFMDLFSISNSFKYFNYFHIWLTSQEAFFTIDPIEPPQSNGQNPHPNAVVKYTITKGNKQVQKKESFIYKWKCDDERNTVHKIIFDPDPNYIADSRFYNLYTGFTFDKNNDGLYDEELIKPFLDHIKSICNNEVAVYTYILDYISHLIQKPHVKTGIILVFYSETQGVGKNIIWDIIGRIFSKYYIKIANLSDLTNRFNSNLQNKILGVCDEINARARDIVDELKDIVTRDQFRVEYKGKEPYNIKDYLNLIFTTNNEMAIKLEKTDRRSMMIHCNEKVLDKDKIMQLLSFLEDSNKQRNLYNFFKKRDISNVNIRNIVMTKYKELLLENDIPAYYKMLKYDAYYFSGEAFAPRILYIKAQEYAKNNTLPRNFSEDKCLKDISKKFGKLKKRSTNGMLYFFPDNFPEIVDDMLKDRNVVFFYNKNEQKNIRANDLD